MIRTQILLESCQQKLLAQKARQEDKSVSQLVREWINEKLKTHETIEEDPLWQIVGMVKEKGGPRDVSSRHDEYLYGKKAKLHWEQ